MRTVPSALDAAGSPRPSSTSASTPASLPFEAPHPSAIPPDVPRALLERTFLRHERRADFEALLESVCQGMAVRDVLEFLCAQSVADAVWDSLRLRRLRDAHLATLERQAALDLITEGLKPYIADFTERRRKAEAIQQAWCMGLGDAAKEVPRLLDTMQLGTEAIGARAFVGDIDTQVKLETLDRHKQRQRVSAFGELTTLRRLRHEEAQRILALDVPANPVTEDTVRASAAAPAGPAHVQDEPSPPGEASMGPDSGPLGSAQGPEGSLARQAPTPMAATPTGTSPSPLQRLARAEGGARPGAGG